MKIIFFLLLFLPAIAALYITSCKKEDTVQQNQQQMPSHNKPPIAHAGADQTITLPTNSVDLNGSGTDDDGSVISYEWTKVSGPSPYIISNNKNAKTKVTNLAGGIYTFELKVTDNDSLSSSDTMLVIVNDPGQGRHAPIAHAGADQTITLPTDSVELKGSGTDADGNIEYYVWNITAYYSQKGQYAFFYFQTPVAQMKGLEEGTYWCELIVTDNDGLSAKDEMIVHVVSKGCLCYPYPCDAFGDPCNPWDY